MARYYCTCKCPKQKALHPVEVRDDGICVKCGYYAFARPNLEHIYYPRDEILNGVMSLSKLHIGQKGMYNEYCLYFHGHEQKMQGISDRYNTKRCKKDKRCKKT